MSQVRRNVDIEARQRASEQFDRDLAKMAAGQERPADQAKERVLSKNFQLAQYRRNEWRCELNERQTLEDCLDPTFWANVVPSIIRDEKNPRGRGDIIEVWQASTSTYARLLIVEIGVGFIKVVPIERTQPAEVMLPEDSKLTTRWNVGAQAHEVMRKADGQIMAKGFQTKAAAAEWIAQHLKAME